jgi:hypothetical protein
MRTLIFAPLMSLAITAWGQTPELQHARRQASGDVSLIVSPKSTNWVTLQASSDLATWHPCVELLTTNLTLSYQFTPGTNTAIRFYRVRHPGTPTAEARGRWLSLKPENYRYTFWDTRPSRTLWGTVSVSEGVKTVTDSYVQQFSSTTTNTNASLVLSVEDVFDLLLDIETQGIQQAEASYDHT